MGKHDVASFDDESKPIKTKRMKGDRYAFHQCFHGDAWQGILDLSDAETGIYWRIILLMYMRRAALPNDRQWLARLCNVTTRSLNRTLKSLDDKGRIVIDEEMGLIFDQRAIRELVASDRFSQEQTERAIARWEARKSAPKRGHKPRVVVSNDTLPAREQAEMSENYCEKNSRKSAVTSAEVEQDQSLSLYRIDANHNQNHIEKEEPKTPPPAPRAATPPLRGSGAPTEKKEKLGAALEALHRAFGSSGRPEVAEEGFEETEPIGAKHGAQTCRRSP